MAVPLEDAEGEAFALRLRQWMLEESDDSPGILEFSHVANETGVRSKGVQIRKNKQGMRRGVPDYVLVIQRAEKDGDGNLMRSLVWIELKRRKGPKGGSPSEISPEQEKWVRLLNSVPNVAAHFAFGHEEAAKIIETYIFTE